MNSTTPDIEWMLAPFSSKELFGNYWERCHLLVERGNPFYYSNLFSIIAVEQLLPMLREPEYSLVRDGKPVPYDTYTQDIPWKNSAIRGAINLDAFHREFAKGSTLIVEYLQSKWPPIALLCRYLERFFGLQIHANAYLTAPRSQGFSPHYDTHDVFVLQVEGVKHWKLHGCPVELPLKDQAFDKAIHTDTGGIQSEFDLKAGDLLYIPRGQIHEAAASDEASLHITIGVTPFTFRKLLNELLLHASLSDVKYRRGIPVALLTLEPVEEHVRNTAQELLDSLGSGLSSDFLTSITDKFIRTRESVFPGQLASFVALGTLSPSTRLIRKPDVVFQIEVADDEIRLFFAGKALKLPSRLAPEIHYVCSQQGPFTLEDMPANLSPDEQLGFLRQVIEIGLLCIQ